MNSDIIREISTYFTRDIEPVDIIVLCLDFPQAQHIMELFGKEWSNTPFIYGEQGKNSFRHKNKQVRFVPYLIFDVEKVPDVILMDKATTNLYKRFIDIKQMVCDVNAHNDWKNLGNNY